MEENFIIDCSGRKVPVGDKLFSAKCWVGNTADYLAANKSHIIDAALGWPLFKLSLVVPIYRSGAGFLPTMRSLLSQRWRNRGEIELILYVNHPLGACDALTRESLDLVEELRAKVAPKPGAVQLAGIELPVESVQLRFLYEELSGGIAEVYQRSFATLVARMRREVDCRDLPSKEEKVRALEALMSSHAFGVVDDDLIFNDQESLPRGIAELVPGESLVLGDVRLSAIDSSVPHWDETLERLMNLFFAFKYELDSAVLTPRIAIAKDLFHLPVPECSVPYADQIWFAAAAKGKRKILVPVTTSILEETYASNAEMTARMVRFLESGKDPDAVRIFENLIEPYERKCGASVYGADEVRALLAALRTRDKNRIDEVCAALEHQLGGAANRCCAEL